MESLDEAMVRHRKEARDLQSRITGKKKNATKKNRKAINDECADLERQLKERHDREIALLNGETPPQDPLQDELSLAEDGLRAEERGETTDAITTSLAATSISESNPPNSAQAQPGPKKRNRQKERLARRAAEQEAQVAEAEEEASSMVDHRGIEKSKLDSEFAANGLVEKEIQPDGHCLFSAIADQLEQLDIPLTLSTVNENGEPTSDKAPPPYRIVRKVAADYMEEHKDDFAPFLEEPLFVYAARVRDSALWGGQMELVALANAYDVDISVIRQGRTERIEPLQTKRAEPKKAWLAYYTRGFGLGQHYNSLRKKPS